MERSEDSLAFEAVWRQCRSAGELIPVREAISPIAFKRFLPDIMMVYMEPDRALCNILLVGEEAKVTMGFDTLGTRMKGFNINMLFPQRLQQDWVERQRSYHDHPAGKVDIFRFTYKENLFKFIEITYLPVWGQNRQRQLLVLAKKKMVPTQLQIESLQVQDLLMIEEMPLDIGRGVPVYSTSGQ